MSAERDRLAALLPNLARVLDMEPDYAGYRILLPYEQAAALADEIEAGRVAVEQVKRVREALDLAWVTTEEIRRALDGTTP